jgi:(R,R)-butanediol dehydrogenase/meso-butanediol dehydrogenase/diacetyl reductase
MPDGLDPRSATLAEPLAVALHAVTQSKITADDSAMIIGAGPIGALTLAVLRHRGIGPITVVEPSQPRRDLALQLGAQRVAEPSELEIFPSWEPEHITENPVSVVFECSGKKAAMEAGFNQLRRGGVLVLVGSGIEHPSFDPNRLILNELQIIGSFIYDKFGFEDALALLNDPSFPSEKILEPEDVSLAGLGDALVNISQGRVAGKVLVAPWL